MRRLARLVVAIGLVVAVAYVALGTGWVDRLASLVPGATSSGDAATSMASSSQTDADAAWPGNSGHGFSWGCITEAQQDVYDQLVEGISSRASSFSITCPDTADIEPAMRALMEDHPEFFWLDGSLTYHVGGLLGSEVTIEPTLDMSADDIDAVQAQIDGAAGAWVSSLAGDASTYDKVRSAYEWVIDNTDYDLSSDQNQNIQSVFVGHSSVCAGYAKAFQYLLHLAGVPCAYVTGQIEEGEHAWDLVCIDGTYTYCDPTWGDPTYFTSLGETAEGNITYDYLCLTTEEIERDHHTADRAAQLPTCDSTAYDWFRLNGTYLTSLDSQAISDAFWRAVNAGGQEVSFKFSDDATYQQAESLLVSHGFLQNSLAELGRLRGQSQVSYSYTMSPELRVVRVFW